ncbi:MAG: zinc-binding alcohol dehydrogenase [Phycisphaerae bacterium]|nr:zinc-binding alcohol dehydrogenase [Phycisphaerae bacterium]
MAKRLDFTGKQQATIEDFAPAPVGSSSVAVETMYSLISTGTEGIVYNRLFGKGTHWDNWVTYPFYPGYATVGQVLDVGADVESLAVGDMVASLHPHASYHVAFADEFHRVPSDVPIKHATWIAFTRVAFVGTRAAGYELGGDVLIIGAGPVGQMAVRWANTCGLSTIIVVDRVQGRLDMAVKGGATHLIAEPVDRCREAVTSGNKGALPRIVMDTTGNARVFESALGLARDRGRVVLLGDTGTPSEQRLTSDVLRRGLTIVGAHGAHLADEESGHRVSELFLGLVRSGRFDLSDLITHEFLPEDYDAAYNLINTRREETMGVLFDWTHS